MLLKSIMGGSFEVALSYNLGSHNVTVKPVIFKNKDCWEQTLDRMLKEISYGASLQENKPGS